MFNVEDQVVLSAKAQDEEGGSGLAGDPVIMVNGVEYDGKPLEAGIYGVSFSVKDNAGNVTVALRVVRVHGDPVINIDETKEELYAEDLAGFDPMKGVSATDPVEFDITDKVTVECDHPEAFAKGIPGTYTFTYTVINSSGRTVTATKTVRILGKPSLFGVKDTKVTEGSEFDPKAGVTAFDNEDGDLTDKIIVEGVVDTVKPGVYTLKYHVHDSHGNKAEATRKVTVEKKEAPKPPVKPEKEYVTLIDKATGISVTAEKAVLPDGVRLVVEKLNKKYDGYAVAVAYDIYFMKGNERFEVIGDLKVEIPYEKPLVQKGMLVFYDDGSKLNPVVIAQIGKNKVSFVTNHFSIYVLANKDGGSVPVAPTGEQVGTTS